MDKKTKKKVIVTFTAVIVLYVFSSAPGMRCDSGNMERAMIQVNQLVKDAREDIQKEMRKPFILRLFGSLFGMEGNKFNKLKNRLPPIIDSAMPGFLKKKSNGDSKIEYSCTGMKLDDALDYCLENHLRPIKFYWRFDSTIQEKKYLKPALSILESEVSGKKNGTFTLQFNHPYNSESGFENAGISVVDSLIVDVKKRDSFPETFGKWLSGSICEKSVKDKLANLGVSDLLDSIIMYKSTGKKFGGIR